MTESNEDNELNLPAGFIVAEITFCEECEEGDWTDKGENKPVILLNECPEHGEEQVVMHRKCLPPHILSQVLDQERKHIASQN